MFEFAFAPISMNRLTLFIDGVMNSQNLRSDRFLCVLLFVFYFQRKPEFATKFRSKIGMCLTLMNLLREGVI